jgi:hypothetical protein
MASPGRTTGNDHPVNIVATPSPLTRSAHLQFNFQAGLASNLPNNQLAMVYASSSVFEGTL